MLCQKYTQGALTEMAIVQQHGEQAIASIGGKTFQMRIQSYILGSTEFSESRLNTLEILRASHLRHKAFDIFHFLRRKVQGSWPV